MKLSGKSSTSPPKYKGLYFCCSSIPLKCRSSVLFVKSTYLCSVGSIHHSTQAHSCRCSCRAPVVYTSLPTDRRAPSSRTLSPRRLDLKPPTVVKLAKTVNTRVSKCHYDVSEFLNNGHCISEEFSFELPELQREGKPQITIGWANHPILLCVPWKI